MEAEDYREKIIEMVGEIGSLRFLKAIYISMSEFLLEKKKEEKPE